MLARIRKSPVVWAAVLMMVAASTYAGTGRLTEILAGRLQAMQDEDARHDWRRITLLGTVAYMDDRGVARARPVMRPAHAHADGLLQAPPPAPVEAP